jgi:uncharacterized protein (TIGR02453 family)
MLVNDILDFLNELKVNNNREWFAVNKARYDSLRMGYEQIVKQLILEISTFDEDIKHVQVKDCVFRIYRDTRFSHDKTPYKTHFGAYIAAGGGRKSQRGGYYLHIDPAGSFIAVGIWLPEPDLLKVLRQSVYDNIDEFNAIRKKKDFAANFASFFEENKLKSVPRSFPKDFPDAEFLKLKHYIVEHPLTDTVLCSESAVIKIAELAKIAYPLNRFLNYSIDERNNG